MNITVLSATLYSLKFLKGIIMHWYITSVLTVIVATISISVFASEPQLEGSVDEKLSTQKLAKKKYQKGIKYFEIGDFQLAAESFRSAYDILKTPSIWFDIGQVEYHNKSHGRALEAFEMYLSLSNPNDAPKKFETKSKEFIAKLESLVAMFNVKMPPKCTLKINGIIRGNSLSLRNPIYVNTHEAQQVTVICEEKIQFNKTFLLEKGRKIHIDATKKYNEDEPTVKKPEKPIEQPGANKKQAQLSSTTKNNQSNLGLPIIVTGTSVILITTAIILDAKVKQRADKIEAGGQYTSYIDTTHNVQTLSRFFGIMGLVGAGISTWLFVRYSKRKTKNEKLAAFHVAPILNQQVTGIALQGGFSL